MVVNLALFLPDFLAFLWLCFLGAAEIWGGALLITVVGALAWCSKAEAEL